MNSTMNTRTVWQQAIRQRSVWLRALKLGLPVGLLQAVINQADVWWRHDVTAAVVIKTIVSPLIGFALVFVSAAATWAQKTLNKT